MMMLVQPLVLTPPPLLSWNVHTLIVSISWGAGQDCVQYGMEMYAAAYMQRDLKMHIAGKHTEYVDAARTTDSKGRNKSSGRSYGSKKRNKSRRSALEYDGEAELC